MFDFSKMTIQTMRDNIHKNLVSRPKAIRFEYLELRKFGPDCGCLEMFGANYASPEGLKVVRKIASMNGFSRIICTVSLTDDYERVKKYFTNAKWKCVGEQPSNRNPHKMSACFVLTIKNCLHKGY